MPLGPKPLRPPMPPRTIFAPFFYHPSSTAVTRSALHTQPRDARRQTKKIASLAALCHRHAALSLKAGRAHSRLRIAPATQTRLRSARAPRPHARFNADRNAPLCAAAVRSPRSLSGDGGETRPRRDWGPSVAAVRRPTRSPPPPPPLPAPLPPPLRLPPASSPRLTAIDEIRSRGCRVGARRLARDAWPPSRGPPLRAPGAVSSRPRPQAAGKGRFPASSRRLREGCFRISGRLGAASRFLEAPRRPRRPTAQTATIAVRLCAWPSRAAPGASRVGRGVGGVGGRGAGRGESEGNAAGRARGGAKARVGSGGGEVGERVGESRKGGGGGPTRGRPGARSRAAGRLARPLAGTAWGQGSGWGVRPPSALCSARAPDHAPADAWQP